MRRGDDPNVLLDQIGRAYTDLEDFRAHNELLTSDDTMLALRDITSVSGDGEAVVVTGHTAPAWPRWLLGGIAVVVALGAGITFVMRRVEDRADARFTAALDAEDERDR